jgi:transcriptional regulator with XRE-family HTH domain
VQDGVEGSSSMKMFGAVSRALREAQGSTREQFGAHVGYSASQVAMVERGERMPSLQFIAKAGEFLHARVAIDAAAEHLERRRYPSWFDDYLEREVEAAYVEGQAGGLVIEDREEVSAMFQRFGMIRSQAFPPGESAKLIEGLVGEL